MRISARFSFRNAFALCKNPMWQNLFDESGGCDPRGLWSYKCCQCLILISPALDYPYLGKMDSNLGRNFNGKTSLLVCLNLTGQCGVCRS